jgi:hypothetical protein
MEEQATALAWAQDAWPDRSWSGSRTVHGAFHQVVLAGKHAARMARGADHRARVQREAHLLRAAGRVSLRYSVPLLIDGPVSRGNRTGFLTTVVAGEPRESGHWPEVRDGLLAILGELALVQLPDAAAPSARTWCGGPDWPGIVGDRLGRHIPDGLTGQAAAVVTSVVAVEQESSPGFVHGDFGLHNILWRWGAPSGLIDFDNLAWADPAIDVAPLVGHFSAAELSRDFDRGILRRAMFHRASLPLQVAAAAELAGDGALRDHALRNFADRALRGTLYDPGGTSPV